MENNSINIPTLKEIEKELFRSLQATYGEVFIEILENLDKEIAERRDKRQFALRDKRKISMDTAFGAIEVKRNYYYDRRQKKYISLLDQYLGFTGGKGFSPLLEEWGLQLATTGQSYRKATETMEQFLGYRLMSHEGLRQHVLGTKVLPTEEKQPPKKVLFVEVDGLYVKSQAKGKRGWEMKFACVHEGWKMNGKRASLVNKRHYLHQTKTPFWERLEAFLLENDAYVPGETLLVINGDGARWITESQSYFGKHACFCLDRFHVARSIKTVMRGHGRYHAIRKKFRSYDSNGLFVELESAVGTMKTEQEEEALAALIQFLTSHKEALGDYRKWVENRGLETKDYRGMGSAESLMSVLAKRLKNGRTWCKQGVYALANIWIGIKDQLQIQTIVGKWVTEKTEAEASPKQTKQWVSNRKIQAVVRGNMPYLDQSAGTPIYQALQGMRGA